MLSTKTDKYNFYNVSNIPSYYTKGDILAVGDEEVFCIEVKNDSRIGKTQNVLCEDEVYIKDLDYYEPGNMSCDCDIYCVVAEDTREIYIIDF